MLAAIDNCINPETTQLFFFLMARRRRAVKTRMRSI
jgi:hypothetical protein